MVFPLYRYLLEPALLGGIGSGEIVLIVVVLLLLFGPKQLPGLAKTIGDTLRGLRRATDDMKEEIGFDEIMGLDPRRGRHHGPPRRKKPQAEESQTPLPQPEEEPQTPTPEVTAGDDHADSIEPDVGQESDQAGDDTPDKPSSPAPGKEA
jgi:TatA/E family protein of Tat protein translocase